MLLRSSIAETLLAAGAELVVCSLNADEPYFVREFSHPQITLVKMPTKSSTWENRLSIWRQYLLMNPSLGGTLNHKLESFRRAQPKRYYLTRALNLLLGNIPLLRHGYMRAENRLFPATEFDPLMKQHKPDLVVTGTPGFNLHDVHALRSAKRLGITTATVMLSWDNLTSKGYMNGIPDQLLVWSDLMADEAVRYHNYPRSKIHQVGAAQFDHYATFRENFDRNTWRMKYGIPNDAPLLMYGTINPALVPHEYQIVSEIVDWMKNGRFSRPVHLWVRLHPQVVQGVYRRNVDNYLALKCERVHIEVPPVHDSCLNWDLPKEDAEHLASLLTASDVVITPNSTLSIDAACVDTPIVNLFHDSTGFDARGMTARRFRFYTHYSKILETGGIAIVDQPEQFIPAIERYLDNPGLDREGRKAILQQQFNGLDGRAGERTAQALLELCGLCFKQQYVSKSLNSPIL